MKKNPSPLSVLGFSSGKDLDLYQTEICSFLGFEVEIFRTVFTGLSTENLFILKVKFGI